MSDNFSGLFSEVEQFPNQTAEARLRSLVGYDELLNDLVSNAVTLLDKRGVHKWSKDMHGTILPAAEALLDRSPVFIFAGDVGVGKTEVAEILGQKIAEYTGLGVELYPLSLTARGHGAVGEMTTLLTSAFSIVRKDFAGRRGSDGAAASMGILLIDEADAIAQSRELAQMHHEDRAGVNALLRGIDSLRVDDLPVLTVLCTNRLTAIDPAVQRRAASIRTFVRPNREQRKALLAVLLQGAKLPDTQLDDLAEATGETKDRPYGFTYSDLRKRLVPDAVLVAYRTGAPLSYEILAKVLETVQPTRPFNEIGEK
jgi:AAA+ superfamily predicted ATPase